MSGEFMGLGNYFLNTFIIFYQVEYLLDFHKVPADNILKLK